jgi:hypothetical protein
MKEKPGRSNDGSGPVRFGGAGNRELAGRFDSEDFDASAATKEMKKGLPDWRNMR